MFALFKHKGKIIAGTVVGLIAATTVYVRWPAIYQSDAKLLVRYVVDRSAVEGRVRFQADQASSSKMFSYQYRSRCAPGEPMAQLFSRHP